MRSVPADEGSVPVVLLHVYDVTKTASDNTNTAIKRFNSVTRDVMGVGGVFHGGVEVNGAEWSYGFCDEGTGVYCCEPKKNPMYTYRESHALGTTVLSSLELQQVIADLQLAWQGAQYDLLTRNCCHFCEDFAARLRVNSIPAWVNRMAYTADSVVKAATTAAEQVQWLGDNLVSQFWNVAQRIVPTHDEGQEQEEQSMASGLSRDNADNDKREWPKLVLLKPDGSGSAFPALESGKKFT
eukprot:jgi/Botrbrau1/5483/Bobra.27_1s0026.1